MFKSLFSENQLIGSKNMLMRDQRVVKMHLFFTRKIMVGSNLLMVNHIPQGIEVSKSTVVFTRMFWGRVKISTYIIDYLSFTYR